MKGSGLGHCGGTKPSSAAVGWVAGAGGGPMRGNSVGRQQIKALLKGEGQRLPVPGGRPRTLKYSSSQTVSCIKLS